MSWDIYQEFEKKNNHQNGRKKGGTNFGRQIGAQQTGNFDGQPDKKMCIALKSSFHIKTHSKRFHIDFVIALAK